MGIFRRRTEKMSSEKDSLVEYCDPIRVKKNDQKLSESSSKFLPTMSKVEKQLSSILPPREIVENGELFIQKVSPEQASKSPNYLIKNCKKHRHVILVSVQLGVRFMQK